MMRAELDALVCSGAMRGKQHTYALLDERIPKGKLLDRDAAAGRAHAALFHVPRTGDAE